MIKRRFKNNLRYYAYWQRLKQVSNPDGTLFYDYVNQGNVFCTKKAISSNELYKAETDRMLGNYRIECRPKQTAFDVSDRLLFLRNSNFKKNVVLTDDQILRIESVIDKTGRGERLTIDCSSGAFAGTAPVEPRSLKSVIFKGAVGSVVSESVIWFLDNTSNYLRAFDSKTKQRMQDKDISLGSGFWLGAVSDGTNIWVIDAISRTATAYSISSLRRTSSQISLGQGSWVGGMSDGVDIWFINNQSGGSMAIAYNVRSLSREGDKDINIGTPSFDQPNWGGGTYSNGILYIADHSNGWLRAWNVTDVSRNGDKDINTGLGNITGIASNDDYVWAIDSTTAKAWSLQDKSRQTSQDIFLGTGGFSGATSNITINDLITVPKTPLEIFKIGFTLDVIIRGNQNPWIFDNSFRIPAIISLDINLDPPVLNFNNTKMQMTKVTNITDISVFYGSEIPTNTTQIYIE